MQRKLTPATTLENLRKEAKRWLRRLRENNADARARFDSAYPGGPVRPVLRDVQHALAREYGHPGWKQLKAAVPESRAAAPLSAGDLEQQAHRFLEYACPDHNVRGLPAHRMARHAAMRVLEENPEIARLNIYTAVVCGEIEEVEHLLTAQPGLVNRKQPAAGRERSGGGGSYDFLADLGVKDWEPLLFLCFTRLPLAKANDRAVELARLLLDHGADPNVFFVAGGCRYTPLVGAIGEGEEDRPPHPNRDELARLLLERGAEPYDVQVNYNIHFHGRILWWLKLMHEFSLRAGRQADWDDPEWHMLDMGGYGSGARWHLRVAVDHNDPELAEWCLAHRANPNSVQERDARLPQMSLYEHAVRQRRPEIAELLAWYGAEPREAALDDEELFVAACMRLDRSEAERILQKHPEFRDSPKAMFAAAQEDRADVAAMLLELGTPVEVQDDREQRGLHVAAYHDAVHVAALLIERGAEIDHYELNYSNTPLDCAAYCDHPRMIELLSPHSRDVWNLTTTGNVDRVRKVLETAPRLAKISWQTTPLFWLPEDENKAIEIVRLFLEHGADAGFRSHKDGSTAADVARKRGLRRAAEMLEAAAGGAGDESSARRDHLRRVYEQVARDMVTVFEHDDEESLERLGRQFDRLLTFPMVRTNIRQQVERLRKDESAVRLELEEARDLIAREAGYRNWAAFLESVGDPAKAAVEARGQSVDGYQQLAQDFVDAFEGDVSALGRLNEHYGRSFNVEDVRAEIWRRVYAFRQRSSKLPKNFLKLEEAKMVIAQDAGFGSWEALTKAAMAGTPPPGEGYAVDPKGDRIGPRRRLNGAEWAELISVMRERRIPALDANGLMTDKILAQVAALDHVTKLDLGGSRELTDDGVLQLARMPQLEYLNLSEYPGGKLTDRGLQVLRHLSNLRTFEMTWQAGITDKGAANLRFCDKLEKVILMGSPTGDGAIEALQGKTCLYRLSTGRLVTDAGLRLLQNFPMLKTFHGAATAPESKEAEERRGAHLLIDGPFSNGGLAGLENLEGVVELDLFWHVSGITSDGFAHLVRMPNLLMLACDGKVSDDTAMEYIGAMPKLRALRAQESVASDDGFVAMSRSHTLERFWGRVCPNFGSRAFLALSKMLSLSVLGVGLQNVDDEALSALPAFPSLRELTPIGLKDDGFRHVGKCKRLERLTCMYCRETTDAATEHIAGLGIRYYYAGLTQITDRSLKILGAMPSLEQVDLYECNGVTDAGLVFLAKLPRLQEVHLEGLPGVTLVGTKVIPANVRVYYST